MQSYLQRDRALQGDQGHQGIHLDPTHQHKSIKDTRWCIFRLRIATQIENAAFVSVVKSVNVQGFLWGHHLQGVPLVQGVQQHQQVPTLPFLLSRLLNPGQSTRCCRFFTACIPALLLGVLSTPNRTKSLFLMNARAHHGVFREQQLLFHHC